MSFDYIYDAKDTLTEEGYPFFVIQFTPSRARYAWDMLGDGLYPAAREEMVAELRRLADKLEQGQM